MAPCTFLAPSEIKTPRLVAGSCTLVHGLLRAGLVDELRLMVFPLSIGGGLRVFPEGHERFDFRLESSRSFDSGITYQVLTRA